MTSCEHCGTNVPAAARFCLQCGASVSDPGAATLLLPQDESNILLETLRRELGRECHVESELGRGGMAVVFKATDLELNRRIALKVLPPELALSRSLAERFRREAKLAASLDHPNIIPVYRVGQAGPLLYIAMKFIDGRALDSVIESQGPLPVGVVLHVIRAATRALAFAHDRGIIHRDIKSANILIDTDGRILVSDFGIARAIEDPTITATGTVVGTPYFMSPEQCAARRIGPQSDQYSLGVVAFQMLSGIVPFHAETLPGIMHHHFYTPVPSLREVRPDIPEHLLEVVTRILSKKPEQRYATTQAMLEAIESIAFPEWQRREGEAWLRALARGAPIPEVVAGRVGPLPELGLTPPHPHAPSPATPPPRRSVPKRRLMALGLGLLPLLAGAFLLARRPAPPAAAVVGDSTRAVVSSRGPDSAAARAKRGGGRARGDSVGNAAPSSGVPATPPQTLAARPDLVRDGHPGKVRIRAYPATAQILVDQRALGSGVVIDSLVTAGQRRLRVVAPGYVTFDTVFTVAAGQTTQLPRINLRPVDERP
jgi:predicted Ser/Thr protein kinase